jgi:hypothetical protein
MSYSIFCGLSCFVWGLRVLPPPFLTREWSGVSLGVILWGKQLVHYSFWALLWVGSSYSLGSSLGTRLSVQQ